MNIVLVILYILLYVSPIYSKVKVISNKTSITYVYPLNNVYYTSIYFDSSNYNLNFTCSTNQTNTECISILSENDMKKLYGNNLYGCTDPDNCDELTSTYYPTPIISPDFHPSTIGGKLLLQGYYIGYGISNALNQIVPTSQYINFSPNIDLPGFDPTNIILNYPSGCGKQIFKWRNGETYIFSYANPSISNVSINGSLVVINGKDFCDSSFKVDISIDGVSINSSSIIKKDQGIIEMNFNQQYSKKSIIKIQTSDVTFIEQQIEFPPEPNSVNSVPNNKGGLVIISGLRLSSSSSSSSQQSTNSNIIIKVGSSNCTNPTYINNNTISCNLPSGNGKDLPISVSINGIKNTNNLIFNYGITRINPEYSSPNRILNLSGDCFGNSNDTLIYLNGNETKVQNLTIYDNESKLSFKVPEFTNSNISVSIKVNGIMSNTIQIDLSFYTSNFNSPPSTYGSRVTMDLNNINIVNYNSIPNILIKSENTKINGVLVPSNSSGNSLPNSQEKKTYYFDIPKGCGYQQITVSIGNQSCESYFTYQQPNINNCTRSNDDIECNGNFGNIQYFNQSSSFIQFSNEQFNPVTIDESKFSFKLNSNYQSGDLTIEVCSIPSNSFKLNITSKLDRIDKSNFNSTIGGLFYLIGQNFGNDTNSSVYCDNKLFDHKFENSSFISFNINIPGPTSLNCNYTFNGQETNKFKLDYPISIIKSTSEINLNGGILTINGDNFYNVLNTTITIGNINCQNPIYINSNSITCQLLPFKSTSNDDNSIFDKYFNIILSFNGITSDNNNIFKYSKQLITESPLDNNSEPPTDNGKKDLLFKLSIALPIILVSLLILSIFIFFKLYWLPNQQRKKKEKEANIERKRIELDEIRNNEEVALREGIRMNEEMLERARIYDEKCEKQKNDKREIKRQQAEFEKQQSEIDEQSSSNNNNNV